MSLFVSRRLSDVLLLLCKPPNHILAVLRSFARQSLICRGLLPFLAAPSPNGEQLLTDAIRSASALGLVTAGDHIVVVQRVHEDFCIKIVGVNADSSVSEGPSHRQTLGLSERENVHLSVLKGT